MEKATFQLLRSAKFAGDLETESPQLNIAYLIKMYTIIIIMHVFLRFQQTRWTNNISNNKIVRL